jgi:2-haloacid dehalogenase
MADAVVFDVMGTLFDLSPLRDRLRKAGAPEGSLEAWFGRMLHSAASLTLAGDFRPFRDVAESTLGSVLEQLGADANQTQEVLQGLGQLDPYPDAAGAVERLSAAGVRLVTLTNGGETHTRGLLARAGLEEQFEAVISVDEVRAYKPHPAPYHRAAERLGLPIAAVTLIAAHGWDVLGAESAGMRGIWVDRLERRWPFPTDAPRRVPDLAEAAAMAISD